MKRNSLSYISTTARSGITVKEKYRRTIIVLIIAFFISLLLTSKKVVSYISKETEPITTSAKKVFKVLTFFLIGLLAIVFLWQPLGFIGVLLGLFGVGLAINYLVKGFFNESTKMSTPEFNPLD